MNHNREHYENVWHREYGHILEFGFLNFNWFKWKPLIDASFIFVLFLQTTSILNILAVIWHSTDLDLDVECGQRILICFCTLSIMCNFAAKRTEFFEVVGVLDKGLSNYNHIRKAEDLRGERVRNERTLLWKYNGMFLVIVFINIASPILDEMTGNLRQAHNGIHCEFPICIWSPIDLNSSWALHGAAFFFSSLVIAVVGANVACFQCLVMLVCNRIIVEMELLIHSLDNFNERRRESRVTADETLFADNVKHYVLILRTYKRVRGIFNYTLVGPIAGGSLIIGLGVVCAVSMDNGSRVGPKTVNLFISVYDLIYFYVVQRYFESIQDMNERVSRAFYGIDWFAAPQIGKSVLFTLTQTTKPLEFRCLKIFVVDSRIVATIVQSAFSLINLMVAVRNKK